MRVQGRQSRAYGTLRQLCPVKGVYIVLFEKVQDKVELCPRASIPCIHKVLCIPVLYHGQGYEGTD